MPAFPSLTNKFILAPLEAVTNLPFRLLCRKYGASMAYTQQISALALVRGNQKSLRFAETNEEDKPVGLQLFGRNPDLLVEAALMLHKNFDVIDLNLGCPSKKIVAQGYGAALLQEKEKIQDLIQALVANIPKPITVKMRSGFKKVEALELVRVIEGAGASAITMHARTQEQHYRGKADWNIIKQVKETVSIPVIGNGDVDSPQKALAMLEETGCDYVMIGRGAMHNPKIFADILHYQKTGEIREQTPEEKIQLCMEYADLDKNGSFVRLKQMCQYFTKGIVGGAKLRERLNAAKTKEEIFTVLDKQSRILF
ncbi:MAG: tRNA-dihydrouridine synthase family protein [Nanoarchaeota archaeon]